MAEISFVPPEQWHTLPIQPPAGLWLKRMVPLLKGTLWAVGLGALLGLTDAFTHYAFPVWIALVPLIAGIVQAAATLPLVVLAMRPYYAERKLGYTTWPTGI